MLAMYTGGRRGGGGLELPLTCGVQGRGNVSSSGTVTDPESYSDTP